MGYAGFITGYYGIIMGYNNVITGKSYVISRGVGHNQTTISDMANKWRSLMTIIQAVCGKVTDKHLL